MGGLMIAGVWALLLGMLTWFAHQWYERTYNPNQRVMTTSEGSNQAVELRANRQGHYLANGLVNGQAVTFLLDTGATSVSLPAHIAAEIGVKGEYPVQVNTANGSLTAQAAELDSVSIGGLTLTRVRGHINPGMQGDEVLLGMSFLRHFNLQTSNNTLTITTP